MNWLRQQRDLILNAARISEGDVVLDVGTGDGILGFGALERVGEGGKVIFSDISSDALDMCKEASTSLTNPSRAEFVWADAQDLCEIPSGSVDVIVERAVLIYAANKRSALKHYFRILRKGGRLSMSEPVNRFVVSTTAHRKIFFGYDFTPLGTVGDKLLSAFGFPPDFVGNPMLNFDERDIFSLLLEVGFTVV